MEISFALEGFLALILVTARVAAFLLVAPPFNNTSIPMRVRGALALGIALPIFPRYIGQAQIGGTFDLLWGILWQVLAGVTVGFVVQLLFSAVQAAGNLVDMFSMFAMASMLDPVSGTQSAVFGRIYSLLATTLLFATGGHLLLLRGLLQTFEVVPVGAVDLGRLAQSMGTGLDQMFLAGLQIGAPILAVLFLTDLALGLVSRAVPSLNIFQLAFPVKTVLVVSMAALGVAMMPGAVELTANAILQQLAGIASAFGGVARG